MKLTYGSRDGFQQGFNPLMPSGNKKVIKGLKQISLLHLTKENTV